MNFQGTWKEIIMFIWRGILRETDVTVNDRNRLKRTKVYWQELHPRQWYIYSYLGDCDIDTNAKILEYTLYVRSFIYMF